MSFREVRAMLPPDWPAPQLQVRCGKGHHVAAIWTTSGRRVWASVVLADDQHLPHLAATLRPLGQLQEGSGRPQPGLDLLVGAIERGGAELRAYCTQSKCERTWTYRPDHVLDALARRARDVVPPPTNH